MADLRAVFFDIDGTLCTYGLRPREALRQLAQEHGVDAELDHHEYYALYKVVAQEGARTGYPDISNEAYRRLLAAHGYDDPALAAQIGEGFRRLRLDSVDLYPETNEVLADLGERYALGIISNGPSEIQRAKLNKFHLGDFFQSIVISGEAGVDKPEAAIFERALDSLHVTAGESVHVGDSLPHDVQGALGAGLTSVWVDRKVLQFEGLQVVPQHTVQNLEELPPLLNRLATPP